MAQDRPRRDNLYYSANLIGMAVGLYLLLGQLLQAALSAALGANLPGAGAANPAGIPVWAAMLLNCLATLVNLGTPILCLRAWARPLGLPRRPLRPPARPVVLLGILGTTLVIGISGKAAQAVGRQEAKRREGKKHE